MTAGRLALLCPGQGGQHAGMFDVLGASSEAQSLLAAWALQDCLPLPLEAALHDESALFANRTAQPLIVAATLAAWENVKPALPAPALIAGYSIGELSAYAVAGAIPPADALSLAGIRAQLMDECVRVSPPQALLAVSGPGLQQISAAAAGAGLSIAIETGPDSAIVGGLREAALAHAEQVAQGGGRAVLLPVTVASHTPLMEAAVAPFLGALEKSRFTDPAIPVVSGLTAAAVRAGGEARRTLAGQISERIRWMDCMDTCAEAGITIALELGPGRALSRMLSERHPHIDCRAVDDFRSVAGIAKWIARHLER